MRMFELMTRDVQTVKPSMAAEDAWALMRRKGIHHLVAMRDGKVAGILSDRDVGGRAGSAVRMGRSVADLMTTAVVTRAPNDTVRSAANVMRGRSLGCLPIVDGGRLVGIVTIADLLEVLARGGDRRVEPSRPPLHWRVPHRRRAQRSW
jgi:acetoin utilization protein AcuB